MKLFKYMIVASAVSLGSVFAQGPVEWAPFQISLFDPVQVHPAEVSVYGLRLNVLYGNNTEVTGLDLGLMNRTTKGNTGLQLGMINIWIDGDLTGLQAGLATYCRGAVNGGQIGGLNCSESLKGIQIGAINRVKSGTGLMIGIVNWADQLDGLQIGLVNILGNSSIFPVLPIINAEF
jgi:hypothetical protein